MLAVFSDTLGAASGFITLGIGALTVVLIYYYFTRNYNYFKDRGIPFVKPYPIIGSALQTFTDFTNTEVQRHLTLGPIYGHFQGSNILLSVGDPVLLRDILIKDFQFFTSRRDFRFGDEVMDSMVSTIRGEDWKRVRTVVTPTFTTGKIKKMMGIFKECADTLSKNFAETKGQDVEIKRLYGAFTMDVIASSAFSTKIDSHNNPDNSFVKQARKMFSGNFSWRIFLFFVAPWIMKLFSISLFDSKGMRFFADATIEIIEERKRTGQKRNDFLQLLLDAAENVEKENLLELPEIKKEQDLSNNSTDDPNSDHHVFKNAAIKKTLSRNELIAQCVIFFNAGYDSTASTLTFCTYFLALNQHIQDKAREEVDGFIQDCRGEITYDCVQQMKYLDNVVSETLRIVPPAGLTERVAETDYELGNTGITIQKDMIVTVPIYALHHDPKYYPDPEKFDPDRFSPEVKAERDPFVYLPFGGGPRNCLGMRFALIETKVCLAYILANFRIKKSTKTEFPLKVFVGSSGLLHSKPILLRMEKREDCPLVK